MSLCSPNSEPPGSAHSAFLHRASTFATLSLDDNIPAAYADLRELLWDILAMSNDANIYFLSWNTISKYAMADLAEYEATGSIDALERLKYKVHESVTLLP